MSKKIDINDIEPSVDGATVAFKEQSHNHDAMVDVFFDQLERNLAAKIREAHFVAGCMAWLTNRQILDALAGLPRGCQVVVQKEDFLRPNPVKRDELMTMYGALRCPDRFELPIRTIAGPTELSSCGDPTCQPVRCMGIRHRQGENGPRMHHKFFVFFNGQMVPYAVWTGSFNATENAARSRENAVYLRGGHLASLYATEWVRTLALSEPLDWTSDYVDPEWRFGS